MLEPVLSGIELQLPLSRLFVFFDQEVNLLLFELLTIEPLIHSLNILPLFLQLFLLPLLCSSRLTQSCWDLLRSRFHIIQGRLEVDVDVGLDDADLVLRLALHDVDLVVAAAVVDVDCVALEHARVVGELALEDRFGVGQVDEGGLVRLKLDVDTFLKGNVT